MIDNFEQILELLTFENEKEFYFLQIIQRKKDFEEGQERLGRNNNSRLIKPYYIYSKEQLLRYKPEIIKLCEIFNARAGINLNKRNQEDVALKCLEMLAITLRKDNDFKGVSKIYSSACGKEGSGDSFWIIDVDTKEQSEIELITSSLKGIQPLEVNKLIAIIPSKSGFHIITKRFDRQKFKEIFPTTEIHVNNPTNLYIP